MKKNCVGIVSILLCLQFCSCTDQYTICNQSKFANLNASFYKITTGGEVDNTPASLTLSVLNSSSFIYNQQPNVPLISTGLNPLADSVSYYIKLSVAMPADTVKIVYSNSIKNLSLECGEINVYDIIRINTTANTIDSIKIVNPAVRNDYQKNLKIYY